MNKGFGQTVRISVRELYGIDTLDGTAIQQRPELFRIEEKRRALSRAPWVQIELIDCA